MQQIFENNYENFNYGRGHGRPQSDIDLAMKLLQEGNSLRSIGRLIGVSHQAITKWIKKYAKALPEIEVADLEDGVEIDELCTFVKKK